MMLGGRLGPTCPKSVRNDLIALNQRWIRRESDMARAGNLLGRAEGGGCFELSPRIVGDRAMAMGVARAGAALFRPVDEARLASLISTVLSEDALPKGYEVAPEKAHFTSMYLQTLRDTARHDPVLTAVMFRVQPSTLRVREMSIGQIELLANNADVDFRPIHGESLSSLIQTGRESSIRPEQYSTLRGWTLLADECAESPVVETLAEPAIGSDRLSQLYNILLLGSVGCRARMIHELTHARRVEILGTMKLAGFDLTDTGGRRYTRTTTLIETTRLHIISSLFLRNYIRARALFGVSEWTTVVSPDAFARAMLGSIAADVVDHLDPYQAHMVAKSYHAGEIAMKRCRSCSSHYLYCENPVDLRGEVVYGDCPVCREIESIRSGSVVVRLAGRRPRLAEVIQGMAQA